MKKIKLQFNFNKDSAIYLLIAYALFLLDLVLKFLEEKFKWNFTVIPGLITVESGHRNSGAAFSMLADKDFGIVLFIIFSAVMILGLAFAFFTLPERFKLLKFTIAFILAGAAGNLMDRLILWEVRDFVWLNMIFSWACCNFADFYIVIGAVIIMLDLLFLDEFAVFPLTKKAKTAQAEQSMARDGQMTIDEILENNATHEEE